MTIYLVKINTTHIHANAWSHMTRLIQVKRIRLARMWTGHGPYAHQDEHGYT